MNNNAIFCRIWNDAIKYGLAFISSNGGTGKTTYFKFRLLKDALNKNIPFHIYVRYKNQMETTANSFLEPKPSYSKRQLKLLERCEIKKENENFIYIVEKGTERPIAQFYNINNQSYYKQFGNQIHAQRAFFDEILSENGDYVSDEINKFNRLIFTMARSDEYHVFGLYNNTKPYFDYFTYFGGKSYTTHTAKSGARFIYFIANQWTTKEQTFTKHSIQTILRNTEYASVYDNNSFTHYPTYYMEAELKDTPIIFKCEIENQIFKFRQYEKFIFIDGKFSRKKSKHKIYSINDASRTVYEQLPTTTRNALRVLIDTCKLKTNNMNDTVFCEILNQQL